MTRHERLFRRLLRMYPARYRDAYEDQMVVLFVDQMRALEGAGSSLAVARWWVMTLMDLIATAPQEHLRKESPVLQPIDPIVPSSRPARPPLQRVAVVAASIPVILAPAMFVLAPGFMDPVLANPPAILGLPAGLVGVAFAWSMGAFGWLVTLRASSSLLAIGAIVFLSVPALALTFMAPALVLYVTELAV